MYSKYFIANLTRNDNEPDLPDSYILCINDISYTKCLWRI